MTGNFLPTVTELRARIAELERLVQALYAHLGVEPPPRPPDTGDLAPEVMELVLRGDTIRAIQLHRENTGCGLREAKEAIDRAGGLIT